MKGKEKRMSCFWNATAIHLSPRMVRSHMEASCFLLLALSTAETELMEMVDGMSAGEAVFVLVKSNGFSGRTVSRPYPS